jgi:hypothetical protein
MFNRKNKTRQVEPVEQDLRNIPDGTAIESKGIYFYVKNGRKLRIPSLPILQSQNYPRVIKVTPQAANAIPNSAAKIGLREGSVVRDISDGKLYLISGNKARHITSPIVLSQLGNPDAILVSNQDILLHEGGLEIDNL